MSCIFNEHSPNRTWTHCVLSLTVQVIRINGLKYAELGLNYIITSYNIHSLPNFFLKIAVTE
jgi:hypothetical protein